MKKYIGIIVLFTLPFFIYAQEKNSECKVLVEDLQGEYRGECKNGLAHGEGSAQGEDIYQGDFKKGYPHGQGKYIWDGDDYYVGGFRKGKRSGYGKHYLIMDGKSSFIEGYWRNDAYIGKEKKTQKYNTIRYTGIDRVSYIYKGDGSGTNEIMLRFRRGGTGSKTMLSNLSLVGTSGDLVDYGESFGYENVEFPFSATLSFTAPNKTNSMFIIGTLNFEILKEGNWDVIIYF